MILSFTFIYLLWCVNSWIQCKVSRFWFVVIDIYGKGYLHLQISPILPMEWLLNILNIKYQISFSRKFIPLHYLILNFKYDKTWCYIRKKYGWMIEQILCKTTEVTVRAKRCLTCAEELVNSESELCRDLWLRVSWSRQKQREVLIVVLSVHFFTRYVVHCKEIQDNRYLEYNTRIKEIKIR